MSSGTGVPTMLGLVEVRHASWKDRPGPPARASIEGMHPDGEVGPDDVIRRFRFSRTGELRDAGFFLGFRDRSIALGFLRQLQADGRASATLRDVLSTVTSTGSTRRLQDHEILEQLAGHLVTRVVVVAVELGKRPRVASSLPEPRFQTRVSRRAPQPSPPPLKRREPTPPEEDPWLVPLDVRLQVETLRRAASVGVPFCEECEKARRARELVAG